MDLGALRQHRTFQTWSDQELDLLRDLGQELRFAPGERLFAQGSEGDSLYVTVDGSIELHRGGHVVARLGPGDVFGEMALFNRYVRVAEGWATSPTTVLMVPRGALQPLVLRQDPVAVAVVQRIGALTVERIQRLGADLDAHSGDADPTVAHAIDEYRQLKEQLLAGWALAYHAIGKPGKLAIVGTKPSATAADLSVAYSPGVAEPCLAIRGDERRAYDYTGKGHLVGIVTNGTAVLGLGDLGALAAKPVMEGKAVLFKRFADVDAFDLEIAETDPERFIDVVCALAPGFGGINLEDIRAPECFRVERECQRRLDIPVMHDDQHGTAIAVAAALENALEVADKDVGQVRVTICGAGAAGVATARLLLDLGVDRRHLLLVDLGGVVHRGRGDRGELAELAADTDARTLADAVADADVFVGVSAGGVLTADMVASMAARPIVLALANPSPEIDPHLARRVRPDVILATGRSDLPNQVNNVLAFPYVFRGALDARASAVTEAMKGAASRAIAALARLPVTPEAGVDGTGLRFGPDYLLPRPFDRRLLAAVAPAVARAAVADGVARIALDPEEHRAALERLSRL